MGLGPNGKVDLFLKNQSLLCFTMGLGPHSEFEFLGGKYNCKPLQNGIGPHFKVVCAVKIGVLLRNPVIVLFPRIAHIVK